MPLVIRIYLYYPSIIHTLEGMGSPTPPQGRIKDIFPQNHARPLKDLDRLDKEKLTNRPAGKLDRLEGWKDGPFRHRNC